MRKLLVDEKQRMLSKRGSVVVDLRTNQMFVSDISAKLEEVRRLISRIDIPVPQVLIEARIVEADENFSRDIGSRLGFAHPGPHAWINGGAGSTFAPLPPGTTTCPTGPNITCIGQNQITNLNFVNLPAAALNGFNPGVLGLTLFNSGVTSVLNLELSALELDGRGKVVSSPRVVTADKVKASIEQGSDIPYQTNTQLGGHRSDPVPQGGAAAGGHSADHARGFDLPGREGEQGHAQLDRERQRRHRDRHQERDHAGAG